MGNEELHRIRRLVGIALWQAALAETVATQKRERDAALESLRERCKLAGRDACPDLMGDGLMGEQVAAAIDAVPLVAP